MGLDLDVLLLIGVAYDEVVEESEEVVESIVKYNENTGVPYTCEKKKKIWKIDDKVFSEEWEAYDAIEDVGLIVYEERGEPVLVGLTLDNHKGERVASGLGDYVDLHDIELANKKLRKGLETLGIKNADINLRTFSVVSF
jgi:hypothetical protein